MIHTLLMMLCFFIIRSFRVVVGNCCFRSVTVSVTTFHDCMLFRLDEQNLVRCDPPCSQVDPEPSVAVFSGENAPRYACRIPSSRTAPRSCPWSGENMIPVRNGDSSAMWPARITPSSMIIKPTGYFGLNSIVCFEGSARSAGLQTKNAAVKWRLANIGVRCPVKFAIDKVDTS